MVMWRWFCAVALAACAGGGGAASSGAGTGAPFGAGHPAPPNLQAGQSAAGSAASAGASPAAGARGLPSECVTTGVIEASLRPTNIVFLVDRSGSMACNLPPITSSSACEQMPAKADATQPSKWEIVRAALKEAMAQLPPSASAALTFFSNDDMCGVQSMPQVPLRALDTTQLGALAEGLDAVVPKGGTPIVGGLILAYKHLNPDQNPSLPYGNRFVVLLTDGQEGCAADETQRLLEVELPKAKAAAITTFVIGVPGSEVNRGFLSKLAFAGGTPSRPDCDHQGVDPTVGDCQFDMTRDGDLAAGLTRALAQIGSRALACEFDVPQPNNGGVLDHAKVNVVYTEQPDGEPQVVKQDATLPCDRGANGWQYSSDKSEILLCGGACDAVRRAASIRIALGCKSVAVD